MHLGVAASYTQRRHRRGSTIDAPYHGEFDEVEVHVNELLAYLAVFVVAAVPWFELFAIPPGIAIGLSPVAVGVLAFASNALATIAVIFGWERLARWREERRGKPLGAGSKRSERARRAFDRYGIPGLAMQGPVLSGMYLAAILALSLGAPRRKVLVWSLASILIWTVALVGLTIGGIEVLGGDRAPLPELAVRP